MSGFWISNGKINRMVRRGTVVLGAHLLLGWNSEALAANWVRIGSAENGSSVNFVDTETIGQVGPYKSGWQKIIWQTDPELRETILLKYYNCASRTDAVKAATHYLRSGKVESVNTPDALMKWQPIRPESLGEAAFEMVCR